MRNARIMALTLLGVMIAASGALAQEAVVAAGATPPAMTLPPDLQLVSCLVSDQSFTSGSVLEDDGRVLLVLTRNMPGDFQFSAPGPAGVEQWNLAVMLSDPDFGSATFGMVNKPPFDVTCTVETPETALCGGEGFDVELPPALLAGLSTNVCVSPSDLSSHAVAIKWSDDVYGLRLPSGGTVFATTPRAAGTTFAFTFARFRVTYAYGVDANGQSLLWIMVYVLNDAGRWEKVLTIKLEWTWPATPPQTLEFDTPLDFAGFLEALSELDAFLMERLGPAARERIDELWRELWESVCALPEFAAVTTVSEP